MTRNVVQTIASLLTADLGPFDSVQAHRESRDEGEAAMHRAVDDLSLGAGNVLFWLRDRGDDLTIPRLWLDRPWSAPDGTSRTSLSLADLLQGAAAYRKTHQELGIRVGDVVVMRIKSPIDVYLSWIALAANGAIAAPVNPNLPFDSVRDYSHRIGASGELIDAASEEVSGGQTKLWWHSSNDKQATPVAVTFRPTEYVDEPGYKHRSDDIVLLCHTSGTTGQPKAVSCSHQGFMVGIRSQLRTPSCPLFGSTVLNALPVAHHSWLVTITWALLSGTKLILASDQAARTLVDDVERFNPDSVRSFSCTLRDVARLNLAPGSLRSVALWMTTGDVGRRRDIATVSALGTHPVAGPNGVYRVPGMFVLDGFGSTELGHLHFSHLHAPGRLGEARCIGRPASFATAAILDEDGQELPEGKIGYIGVQSGAVTPGYWNDPERTAKSRLGRFWITGDVGYRDMSGRYFHLDRHSDVIETPYGAVYSVRSEEELLRSIATIERCAVVGRRNDDGSIRVVCLVESNDSGRDSETWHDDINAVLSKVSLLPVAETIVVPPGTLPLGPTGKIRKFLARAQLRSQSQA